MKQISKHSVNKLTVAELKALLPFVLTSDNEPIAIFISPMRSNTYTHNEKGHFVWELPGQKVPELRKDVIVLLGAKCAECGYDDERALQIDHILGEGNKDRQQYSSVARYYEHILVNKGRGYQLLCANCNVIKARERGEYVLSSHDVRQANKAKHDVR